MKYNEKTILKIGSLLASIAHQEVFSMIEEVGDLPDLSVSGVNKTTITTTCPEQKIIIFGHKEIVRRIEVINDNASSFNKSVMVFLPDLWDKSVSTLDLFSQTNEKTSEGLQFVSESSSSYENAKRYLFDCSIKEADSNLINSPITASYSFSNNPRRLKPNKLAYLLSVNTDDIETIRNMSSATNYWPAFIEKIAELNGRCKQLIAEYRKRSENLEGFVDLLNIQLSLDALLRKNFLQQVEYDGTKQLILQHRSNEE